MNSKRSFDEYSCDSTFFSNFLCDDNFEINTETMNMQSFVKQAIICTCCCEIANLLKQCSNGHLICGECWKKCPTCPTCRVKRQDIRALSVEQMASGIVVSCSNDVHGCCERIRYDKFAQHLQECKHSCVACCPIPGCVEKIKINKQGDILRHIMQHHRVKIKNEYEDVTAIIPKAMRISRNACKTERKMGWSLIRYEQNVFSIVSMQYQDKFSVQVTSIGMHESQTRFFAEVSVNTTDGKILSWKHEVYNTQERYLKTNTQKRVAYVCIDIPDILDLFALPIHHNDNNNDNDMMLKWKITISKSVS